MCKSSINHHKILGQRMNGSQGRNPKSKIGITTSISKCNNCGLIYSNPQPIPNHISDHYGVPPEDYWAEDYFKVDDNYFQNVIKRTEQLMEGKSCKRALDIGAGLGKCMMALSKSGMDVYGIEPSEQFHKRAIDQMRIAPEKLQLSMIEEANFPDDYFDFITFGAVLEHLYDPSDCIKKALQWLKPNCFIYIEVPSSDWLVHKLINLYYRIIGTDYVGNLSPMHEPYHLFEFRLKSFEENGKIQNYQIARREYDVCQTYLPRVVDYFIKPVMKHTKTGMQLNVWLKKVA